MRKYVEGYTDAWEQRKFQDMFSFERPDPYIVKSDKYSNEYTMPVLTANKAFVLGYTKENSPCKKTSLIFDDFTLECKYVDFPYMVKSSAIKILTVKDEKKDNLRFSFERLNTTKIEILGHARHYISVVQPTKTRTPNILEQNKISELFSNLDNLITLHQRKLDKLSNVKKALLEKMFPKNDSDVPEIRFKGFTDAWEQRKLGDFGSVCMNKRIFKNQTSENDEIPFYKIGTFGGKADAFISRSLFEEYKSKYPYPVCGDILISASGSIGRTVEYQGAEEYFQDSNIVWLNHRNTIHNPFLKYFYAVVKWNGIEGSTIKRLYNENILNTQITLPQKPEQQKIGTFFSNLDNLITLHQRKLEKLKNIKKACLEKMFV